MKEKKRIAPKELSVRDPAAQRAGEAIDKFIGVFAPAAALRRRAARELLTRAHNQYAAAKTTRLTGPWLTKSAGVNEIIRASAPTVRARVRQLVRDFPYFQSAVDKIVDYTVGQGITFQSRVYTPGEEQNKIFDKKAILKIEDAFKRWMDEADAAKQLHFYEIMQLTKRMDVADGEFIIILKNLPRAANRYIPFALQVYEADWLTSAKDTYVQGDKQVSQGVEYLRATGEVTGYYFADPDGFYKSETIYVPAAQALHGFKTLRPMQRRGISQLAAGVLVAHDLSDYMDAEIDAAKFAAKYLAFIETADPAARQILGVNQAAAGDSLQKIENMENAIIEYLRPGEKVEIAKHDRPGTTFPPFVKLILTMLSVTSGVPYELLSGDYSGMNYSTMRTSRKDFAQVLQPVSARHVRQFCHRAFTAFLDIAVLSGKLDLAGYWSNPRRFWEGIWTPPGMDAVDPLRESKAQIESIEYGLKSPQEVARERGRDLEQIYEEIREAQNLAREMGLNFNKPSTSLKNNPAALDDNDE